MMNNQFKNIQLDYFKGGKDNKSQKGGKDQQKGINTQAHQLMQSIKGVKDLKQQMPSKDQKSVKFNVPIDDEDEDDFDDEFDDEDDDSFDDYDDEDEFDDEEEDGLDGHHHQKQPTKIMANMGGGGNGVHGVKGMMNANVKSSGNGKKGGGGFELPMQFRGWVGKVMATIVVVVVKVVEMVERARVEIKRSMVEMVKKVRAVEDFLGDCLEEVKAMLKLVEVKMMVGSMKEEVKMVGKTQKEPRMEVVVAVAAK